MHTELIDDAAVKAAAEKSSAAAQAWAAAIPEKTRLVFGFVLRELLAAGFVPMREDDLRNLIGACIERSQAAGRSCLAHLDEATAALKRAGDDLEAAGHAVDAESKRADTAEADERCSRERAERYKAALEEIATRRCYDACGSSMVRCEPCVARAALEARA